MIPWKRSSKSNICFMTNLLLGVLTECDAWETGWENPEQRQLLTGLASSVRDICWKGDNLKLPRYTSSDFLCWSSFKRTKPHQNPQQEREQPERPEQPLLFFQMTSQLEFLMSSLLGRSSYNFHSGTQTMKSWKSFWPENVFLKNYLFIE